MRITAYRFIMAAMAALAAGALAVSCSKEPVAGNNGGGGSDGVRTISVSFGEGTRTALGDKKADGTIPAEFKAGDVILVSNGKALEDCKVIIDGNDTTITTTLKGTLDAVYPPEAAVYLGYNITGFKVSDSQSGRFADAHICTATIADGATEAHFTNETAILKFYVDKSIGVTSIKITSSGPEIATGSKTITVTAPHGKTLADVTDDTKKRICYVSVLPGVKASELTYETVTTTQPTLPRTPTDDVALTASKLYKAFMPYYIKIGSQRWGYCNVGAFLPEEAGRYFAWGETTGMALNSDNTFTFPNEKYYTAENHTWDMSKGFSWENCPHTNGIYSDVNKKVFTKYTAGDSSNNYAKSGTADGKAVLEPEDDAAYVNWGKNWRMPTGDASSTTADFSILANACRTEGHSSGAFAPTVIPVEPDAQGVYYYNGPGRAGLYFVDEAGNKLFFPTAGDGKGLSLDNTNAGFYWTSNHIQDYYAYLMHGLHFTSEAVDVVVDDCVNSRFYGFPIRPILNDAWWYKDIDDGGTI